MGKIKRITLIILGIIVLIYQWNLTYISARATETQEKEINNTLEMGIGKLDKLLKSDIEGKAQDSIAELIDQDVEKMILLQGGIEVYKWIMDDYEERKENKDPGTDYSFDEIFAFGGVDAGLDVTINEIRKYKDKLEALEFSDRTKLEFEAEYGEEYFEVVERWLQKQGKELNEQTYKELQIWDDHKLRMDKYKNMVGIGEGLLKVSKECFSDDPDKLLKIPLAVGDMFSDIAGGNGGIGSAVGSGIWKLNSSLWGNLMKTEEYKKFVEEHEDDFGKAFWESTLEGWRECINDIPRELCNLFGIGNTGHDFDFSYTPQDIEVKIWDPITMEFKCSKGVTEYNKNLNLTTVHGSLDGAHVVIEWGMSIDDLNITYYGN